MAIHKETNFYGFTTDIYVKISGMLIRETGTNPDGNKLYSVEVQTDYYTNPTKEYHIKQEIKQLKDLTEWDLQLSVIYTKLKEYDEFTGFEDYFEPSQIVEPPVEPAIEEEAVVTNE